MLPVGLPWITVVVVLISLTNSDNSHQLQFMDDWGYMGGQPVCVDIPRNMSLCHSIGYSKMRMPNLLEHDTMGEALEQAASWVPLVNTNCHPDAQLFFCSLFSPVCLDRPIYPCRSLCEQVKGGCEGRMRRYGYSWPDMMRCDKYPLDNDMCITVQSDTTTESSPCQACHQADTYENILDNFCRAEFAVKTRVKKLKKARMVCRKSKVFKTSSTDKKDIRAIRRPTFKVDHLGDCCGRLGQDPKINYLIMGVRTGGELVPTFIMEWHANSKAFRNAIRVFKNIDCSNPRMLSDSVLSDTSDGIHRNSDFPSQKTVNDNAHRISGPELKTHQTRRRHPKRTRQIKDSATKSSV